MKTIGLTMLFYQVSIVLMLHFYLIKSLIHFRKNISNETIPDDVISDVVCLHNVLVPSENFDQCKAHIRNEFKSNCSSDGSIWHVIDFHNAITSNEFSGQR